jgi:glycerol-3-phosphate dehydrogenase
MAPSVLDRVEREPALAQRVCAGAPTILAQLTHAVQSEWALSLGDVLLRRTPLGLQACQALDCLETVVDHLGPLLDWSLDEKRRQVDAYRAEIAPMRRFSRNHALA